MTDYGVDYSWARPDLGALVAAGKSFVCRYLSGSRSGGKDLSPPERDAILAAGLAIILVWETDGRTGPLSGSGNGDAAAAIAEAQWLGAPTGTCIYFAVDFQAMAGDAAALEAYARGVTAACHAAGYRSGIYGGLATEQYEQALVDCLWQTYAWSSGNWFAGATMRQYANGVTLAGGDVDLDQAMTADYGQWGAQTRAATINSMGPFNTGQGVYWITPDGQLLAVQNPGNNNYVGVDADDLDAMAAAVAKAYQAAKAVATTTTTAGALTAAQAAQLSDVQTRVSAIEAALKAA